jgi:hypothetical protein
VRVGHIGRGSAADILRILRVVGPPVTFGGMADVTNLLNAAAAGNPQPDAFRKALGRLPG